MTNSKFSRQLSEWLAAKKQRTLEDLIDKFKEKSFAILFLLLMAIPALPLPTGGVTHIFEIIVMLISLELIAGKRTVWLPKRWRKLHLPNNFQKSALPILLKLIRRVEKYSRARLTKVLENALSLRLMGLIIFIFTLFAFLAPPFSGLDTLPALGVVIISLALIFEDLILAIAGLLIGIAGIGLIITLGKIVFKIF